MKIDRKESKIRHVTMRIDEEIMKRIDGLKESSGLSRQRIISQILRQTTEDKGFVLRVGK